MVFAIGEKNFSKINSLPTSTTIEKQAKQASKQAALSFCNGSTLYENYPVA